jgi:deoxyribodipyrimidine photo-lyase
MPDPKLPITLFWFRRDLRLEDNTGLYHALKQGENVQPIFIFDRHILDQLEDRDDRRVSFIHVQLERLHAELRRHGSSLWTFYDTPIAVFKHLTETHNVQGVFANRDYEPYARKRDKEIFDLLESKGIRFRAYKDHVIFDRDEVLKDDGTPYTVYTPYSKRWKAQLTDFFLEHYPSEACLDKLHATKTGGVRPLEEMGFERHPNDWPSAEVNEDIVRNYHLTRDLPGVDGTTKISVHLRFGTVSVRKLTKLAIDLNQKWYNELIWREFYQSILWHFPHVVKGSFKPQYDRIQWLPDEAGFEAWCAGQTGYPIVDAGMRELNATGYMHNRVRMIVASFLTKDLLIDWRWGEAYFARKLLDFDLASNNGGWQWAAGSGVDAAPYFRIFNPYNQTEKFDPDQRYIQRWVPEVGTSSYVKPIVDHHMARERALKVYKEGLGKA